jgi:glycosyltransferase involved in cell wall biosynthesis
LKKLSIVIPAYNEESTLGTLLELILKVNLKAVGFDREIIVVDDGSKDSTAKVAKNCPEATVISQANQGKGKAVQRGVREATGDYILVQDADLEYDPQDYVPLLRQLDSDARTCAYGSRVLGQVAQGRRWGRHPEQGFGPWLAGTILSLWTFLLYGRWITDTLTAYKVYPTAVLKSLTVRTSGFETDHELTAKLIRKGMRIREVPIRYLPRGKEEGKKIRPKDGFIAIWTLLKYRFVS